MVQQKASSIPLAAAKDIKPLIGCTINDCLNGGICYIQIINGHALDETKCKCPLGYGGPKCEQLVTVHLAKDDSYMEFESQDMDNFNLTFTLATKAEHGILLYHGSKAREHISVELFKGRIRVSLDMGNEPELVLLSQLQVNDSEMKRIEIMIDGRHLALKVNDAIEQLSSKIGKFDSLNVGFEAVYVGGVPISIRDRIGKQLGHVSNTTSLKGCISSLYVNSELRDLDDIEYSHHVEAGCRYMEACYKRGASLCENGAVCTNIFNLKADFECTCPEGFSGDKCQIRTEVTLPQYRAIALSSKNSYQTTGFF